MPIVSFDCFACTIAHTHRFTFSALSSSGPPHQNARVLRVCNIRVFVIVPSFPAIPRICNANRQRENEGARERASERQTEELEGERASERTDAENDRARERERGRTSEQGTEPHPTGSVMRYVRGQLGYSIRQLSEQGHSGIQRLFARRVIRVGPPCHVQRLHRQLDGQPGSDSELAHR